MEGISQEFLNREAEKFAASARNRVAMNAATNNGIGKAAANCLAPRESRHSFSVSLEQGEITNQKQSGRCWMFAALNTMRVHAMQKLVVKTFELSQAYPLCYD